MLYRLLVLLLVSTTMPAWSNATESDAVILTPAQVEADVLLAQKAYSRMHPGYTRYTDETVLDEAWQSIVNRAKRESGLALEDMYLELQSVLTLIRCDHTKAELPKVLRERRKTEPFYLPARIDVVERRGFVRIALPENELRVADEILTIDGRKFADVLTAVEKYIPYDGETEWSRNSGLTESLEFMGGAVDHFGALLWKPSEQATLNVRRFVSDGSRVELKVSVDRINFEQWVALNDSSSSLAEMEPVAAEVELNSNLPGSSSQSLSLPLNFASNFKDAIVFRRIGEDVAYLRVDTFVNYRDPVDPVDLYRPVFKIIEKEKRGTLILDLRSNGGGSNDAQRGLMAHLIQKPVRPVKDMRVATIDFEDIREHLWTWDKRALKPNRLGFKKNEDGTYSLRSFVSDEYKKVKPAKHSFDGELIALVSNSNSSATTNLLSVLREHRPVKLVGQATGGSAEGVTAGLLFTLTLPESKITSRIPFFHTYNNVRDFVPGYGLEPDVKVAPKADQWSISYDPVLDAALQVIK